MECHAIGILYAVDLLQLRGIDGEQECMGSKVGFSVMFTYRGRIVDRSGEWQLIRSKGE